jgi:tripartite-type tricarboxylate transporter receptor subunit TctC
MGHRIARRTALGALGAAIASAGAHAQDKFPSKPIEVVTHAGVGGGTDITARMMMVHGPSELKTEFVIVNRTGGSGAAALAYAAGRARDGHTIMLITQTHLLTMHRSKTPTQFDDLVALARATDDPQIVMVRKESPIKTPQDLIAAGKSSGLKFGTTQLGGVDHIGVVQFAAAAGLKAPVIVPFRGGGDIVINLVGGNIDTALLNYAEAESQIKNGEVRPIVALSEKRLDPLPNVSTARELGINSVFSTVRGFVALKGTPEDVLTALEAGLVKAMNGPLYQAYLTTSGQSLESVVGRKAWQAQLERFNREGKDTLQQLGLLK